MLDLAHGVGRVYESPIPVSYYLGGAALTVLASFFIRAFARSDEAHPDRLIGGERAAGMLAAIVRVYLLAVFVLTLAFAVIYPDHSGFGIPPLMFWIGLVILPVVVFSTFSGLWYQTNPWATIEGTYRVEGEEDESPRQVPEWLPPVMIYGLFWFELVSGRGFDPLAILLVLLGYTVYALYGRRVYGRSFSDAEPLGILFGFAERMAPVGVEDRRVVYRGFVAGLDESRPMPSGLFAAVFVLLASTTLDNVRETVQWYDFQRLAGLDGLDTTLLDSVALLVFTLPFAIPFFICAALARVWAISAISFGDTARRFGWSLIPIGIAYVLAHNMPLLIIGLPALLRQIAQGFGGDLFATYVPSPQLVWILEIGLIVGGHVIGVMAAHRAAIEIAGSHKAALKSHIALTVLMSLFTVTTLLLLSLPIVSSR